MTDQIQHISSADRDPGDSDYDFFDCTVNSGEEVQQTSNSDINNNILLSLVNDNLEDVIPPTLELEDNFMKRGAKRRTEESEETETELSSKVLPSKKRQIEYNSVELSEHLETPTINRQEDASLLNSLGEQQLQHRRERSSNLFPTNNTLNSFKKGTTILISPIAGPSKTNITKFSSNPVTIAKSLQEFPYNQVTPKEVRRNTRRNIVVIELFETDLQMMDSILKATNFGNYIVKCSRPLSDIICSGVIGPIDSELSNDEIRSMLRCHTDNIEIHNVSRLNKFKNTASGKKEISLSVKIDFIGNTIPRRVYIGCISFPVRKYNLPPLRCYKCQQFGHMASGCTSEERCNICSGKHNMRDCTSKSAKCANCGGAHSASSRNCQRNKEAAEIDKKRQSGISFQEARSSLRNSRARQILDERGLGNNLTTTTVTAEVHHSLSQSEEENYNSTHSYAEAVSRNNSNQLNEETIKKHIDNAITTMTNRLFSFLQEVLSMNFHKESQRGRMLLMMNSAKHHLGIDVNEKSLDLPNETETNEVTENLQPNRTTVNPTTKSALTAQARKPTIMHKDSNKNDKKKENSNYNTRASKSGKKQK